MSEIIQDQAAQDSVCELFSLGRLVMIILPEEVLFKQWNSAPIC